MSLRRLSLLSLIITLLLSALMIYLASQVILTRSFDQLEHTYLEQNIQRVQRSLADSLDKLASTAGDYAAWDDSYSFVKGEYPDYPSINVTGDSMANLGLNLMLFTNASGKLLFAKGYDLVNSEETPISKGLSGELKKGLLTNHETLDSSLAGIINLPEGPMLVASRPIITSAYEGPIAGSLIIGTNLDESQVEALGQVTNLPLTYHALQDKKLPATVRSALLGSTAEAPEFSQVLDQKTIAGYVLLKDIYGDPVGVMQIDVSRDISAQGQTTLQYVLVALIAASLISAAIGLIITQWFVVDPTVHLSHDVAAITEKGNLSLRVSGGGAAELKRLTGQINEMLGAIEAAEARNRAFLDAIPDTMVRVKSDGTVAGLRAGKEFAERVAQAKTGDTIQKLGDTLAGLSEDATKRLLELVQQVIRTGEPARAETALKLSGEERDYEARIVKSGPDEAVLIARDIYARKQAEELERRGVLLREIHHRVKNNLQVVASMINLQARTLTDEKMVNILRDSRSRIVSMGLIHEKLYKSTDYIGVDFSDYLRDLVLALFKSYPMGGKTITSKVDVEPCVLSMEKAIPCGLLVNELVSNALKHAFPEGRPGELYVGLHKKETGRITLQVRDNGVGMPEGVDLNNSRSLGMQLVHTLTQQLNGEITVKNDKGATFEVTFSPT